MQIKTTLMRMGGSTYIRIPPALLQHLEIVEEDKEMVVQDEEGKYGNYFSSWKTKEKMEE